MEEKEIINTNIDEIKNLIYTIRGKQVMLDSDVARLYKYEAKNVNKAMKRKSRLFSNPDVVYERKAFDPTREKNPVRTCSLVRHIL